MKSNIKKKERYNISMCLVLALILVFIPAGQAAVSADRTIDKIVLSAGESTNATVVIQNDNLQRALSLKETIPTGWILTKGTDDSSVFKPSTNEWVWFTVNSNEAKTVKYKITVPSDTSPGKYDVNGAISSTTDNSNVSVKGISTVEVVASQASSSFTFTISPLVVAVDVGNVAKYNLTVSNTGSKIDTYDFLINRPSSITTQLSKNSLTVEAGNSSVSELSVTGSATGAYVVNVTAAPRTNIGSKNVSAKIIITRAPTDTTNTTDIINVTMVATPSTSTVEAGKAAKYNLTIGNKGATADTYDLVADKPNNTVVQLSKNNATVNSITVGAGNNSIVELSVSGSVAGVYTVKVSATSKAKANDSASVTTTTTVTGPVIPVLTVENLTAVPSSAISKTSPAKISANVKKGNLTIDLVDFGIVDANNLLGKGVNTAIMIARNISGAIGLYKAEDWPASYVTLGNVAVTDVVTTNTGDVSGIAKVRGVFKENKTSSNGTDAVLSFNRTTGNLSSIEEFDTGKILTIQNANSTFQATTTKFTSGNITIGDTSTKAFTLYSTTGNAAVNNPRIVVKTVPNGKYKLYALAKDASSMASQSIDIDTTPSSGTSSGTSSGSSGGGSGDGTYPTITTTTKPNATVNATVSATATVTATTTVVETIRKPVDTVKEEPINVGKKGSPGFGIIAVAIGMIVAILILRKIKK